MSAFWSGMLCLNRPQSVTAASKALDSGLQDLVRDGHGVGWHGKALALTLDRELKDPEQCKSPDELSIGHYVPFRERLDSTQWPEAVR